MKPIVVCSIQEPDADAARRSMASVPPGAAMVELRADRLRQGEVEALVRDDGPPRIVTVRSARNGGAFDGSEAERRAILGRALTAGAAFVDVEWDGALADLASGPDAGRVILSHHGAPCERGPLEELLRAMMGTRAARLKIVPRASRPADALVVRELLLGARGVGRPVAAFALGPAGVATRILGPSWGSWATYGSVAWGRETGDSQLRAADLLGVYDVLRVGAGTRLFGLAGRPIGSSPSPAMHAAGYGEIGLDARYLPIETASLDEAVAVMGPGSALGLESIGVTIPLKEEAALRSQPGDPCAAASRAVNTLVAEPAGLRGYNTDGPAAVACVRRHLDPRGLRVAVAGAGGTARAVGWSLADAGASVAFFNRDLARAERAAADLGAIAAPWADLAASSWDVLVQATPLGRAGEEVLPESRLTGRLVLDAVYAPAPTPLVAAARRRGLAVVDGSDLLVEQALLQFGRMTGRSASAGTMRRALEGWLAGA